MACTVLLVEDEDDTRQRLARMLRAAPDLQLLAAHARLGPALEAVRAAPPDVLVTDLRLPDGLGYDLIAAARAANEQMAILVVSVLGEEAALAAAIRAGADGYLLKDADEDTLVEAIAAIRAGGSPISAAMARFLLDRMQWAEDSASDSGAEDADDADAALLTPGEQRVLSCIARGYTYREVAEHLHLSPNTVPSHIKNIYRKLRVHSRGEAVFEALRRGILERP